MRHTPRYDYDHEEYEYDEYEHDEHENDNNDDNNDNGINIDLSSLYQDNLPIFTQDPYELYMTGGVNAIMSHILNPKYFDVKDEEISIKPLFETICNDNPILRDILLDSSDDDTIHEPTQPEISNPHDLKDDYSDFSSDNDVKPYLPHKQHKINRKLNRNHK